MEKKRRQDQFAISAPCYLKQKIELVNGQHNRYAADSGRTSSDLAASHSSGWMEDVQRTPRQEATGVKNFVSRKRTHPKGWGVLEAVNWR